MNTFQVNTFGDEFIKIALVNAFNKYINHSVCWPDDLNTNAEYQFLIFNIDNKTIFHTQSNYYCDNNDCPIIDVIEAIKKFKDFYNKKNLVESFNGGDIFTNESMFVKIIKTCDNKFLFSGFNNDENTLFAGGTGMSYGTVLSYINTHKFKKSPGIPKGCTKKI